MGLMPDTKQPLKVLEDVTVFIWASKTRPGLRHYTYLYPLRPGEDCHFDCTCEGFNYHAYCWHTEWVEKEYVGGTV